MQMMLKGTDILLYSGGTAEIVQNVLIGEQQAVSFCNTTIPSYTMAIPKGDTHEWTNRVIEFFGRRWRTVGYPEQGIEENIPLAWHKKVRVELMLTSGACTIYEKDTYTRHIATSVYLYDSRGQITLKEGVKRDGELTVHIYADATAETSYAPKVGDIIVSGVSDFVFATETEREVSESMTEFRRLHPGYAVVNAVSAIAYGAPSLPDYDIKAR